MASNRVIGRCGQLPWHLPEDLKFFKRVTMGHPIVMGRTTFESIGRPLPGRRNLVLSTTMARREGVEIARDVSEMNDVLGEHAGEVFVIGGAKVYAGFLSRCSAIYLTYVFEAYGGDTYFPAFEEDFEMESVLGAGDAFEIRRYVREGGDAR